MSYIKMIDVRKEIQKDLRTFYERYSLLNLNIVQSIINSKPAYYFEFLCTDETIVLTNPDKGWKRYKFIVVDFRPFENAYDHYNYSERQQKYVPIRQGILDNGKKYRAHFTFDLKLAFPRQ